MRESRPNCWGKPVDMTSLEGIYGRDATVVASQSQRHAHVHKRFIERFGSGPCLTLRTPGRINLIGEHTDYNGGFVLPVALDRDILCAFRPRDDSIIRAANVEDAFPPFSFALSTDIEPAPRGDWSNYVRGAGQEICRHLGGANLHGADLCISGDAPHGVPRGSGLSSSTALTVTAALALIVGNGIEMDRIELAHLCSEAEWYVGTRGGMMDQFAALLSQRDHALFLDCRPSSGKYAYEHVPVPGGVQIALLNSGVRHENVRSEFNQRVAECKIGVRLLQQRFPSITHLRDVAPEALNVNEAHFWAALSESLPACASAGELVQRGLDGRWLDELAVDHRLPVGVRFAVLPRCWHVVTENRRVLEGIDALRAGEVQSFGALMTRSHESMSSDYGASCPEVDFLVTLTSQQPGVLGARITGAGWGGSVVALAGNGHVSAWAQAVRTAYRQHTGLDCEIVVCRPGDGAGLVRYPV